MIKRVGIDLDNTVADYMALAVPLLENFYGGFPREGFKWDESQLF